jgi:hypothetical protein
MWSSHNSAAEDFKSYVLFFLSETFHYVCLSLCFTKERPFNLKYNTFLLLYVHGNKKCYVCGWKVFCSTSCRCTFCRIAPKGSRCLLRLLDPEDEATAVLQIVGNCMPNNTMSHPRRLDFLSIMRFEVLTVVNSNVTLISGFRRDVDESCTLMGYYAASCGNCLPTFWDNVSVTSSQVKNPSRKERKPATYKLVHQRSMWKWRHA